MLMIEVEITKMSSRGQIVIPQGFRDEMQLKEGEAFAVTGGGDTLLLKRIKTPSREEIMKEWVRLNKEGQKHVKKLSIKESDVEKIIHRARGVKEC